jgi:hypothetical protein
MWRMGEAPRAPRGGKSGIECWRISQRKRKLHSTQREQYVQRHKRGKTVLKQGWKLEFSWKCGEE